MAKKDLKKVQTDLSVLAGTLPTQHVRAVPAKPAASTEEVIQISFSLRKRLRKELVHLANDADMTMRAFVLSALKDKGLSVTEADLLDLRKRQ